VRLNKVFGKEEKQRADRYLQSHCTTRLLRRLNYLRRELG